MIKKPAKKNSQARISEQRSQGFTLIELMIVVTIIGILAAAASPIYVDYIVRGQVADGISIASGAKAAVAGHYHEHGTFPADNTAAALAPAASIKGNYVISVTVAGPVISIMYGNKANTLIAGETIILTAADASGSLTWACGSGGVIADKHLPRACL